MKPKIHLSTPAYTGQVAVNYALALASSCARFSQLQIPYVLGVGTSGSLLVMERNNLVRRFLESDCTHMLCIDSDIGWQPHTIIDMINHDVDFIAGLYPSKIDGRFFYRAYVDDEGQIRQNEKGLIKVSGVPAGFMLIKRVVFMKIMEKFPQLHYISRSDSTLPSKSYAFFNTVIQDGTFWGEDYVFCELVHEVGIDIWIDPFIELSHGDKRGSFYEWCKTNLTPLHPSTEG